MRKFLQGFLGLLASAAIVSPTHATTMVAHFRGYGDGTISEDVFNVRTLTLSNTPFSSTVIFDTDVGIDTSGPGVLGRSGGVYRTPWTPNPVSSATLTIKGLDFQFSDDWFDGSWDKSFDASGAGSFGIEAARDDQIDDTLILGGLASGLTSDPTQPFASSEAGGGFVYWDWYGGTPYPETAYHAELNLRVTYFDVEPLSLSTGDLAVPEPETWLEMLVGFVGLGAVLRRQRNGVQPLTG